MKSLCYLKIFVIFIRYGFLAIGNLNRQEARVFYLYSGCFEKTLDLNRNFDVMKAFSFIIPVRIDNEDRLRNLQATLNYLFRHFTKSEVIIVENAQQRQVTDLLSSFPSVKYVFIENAHEFARSRTINAGARVAEREYLVIYDLDVFISPAALQRSARILGRGHKKVILPHNTIFMNVSGETKRKIMDSLDISSLPVIHSLRSIIANPELSIYPVSSGVVIFERSAFLIAGGFNRNMTSYGWEDVEILKRMFKLGFYSHILGGYNVIHLDHKRGSDSQINAFYLKNKAEYLRVKQMSAKELHTYIHSSLALDFNDEIDIQSMSTMKDRFRPFQMIHYYMNYVYFQLRLRGFIGVAKHFFTR